MTSPRTRRVDPGGAGAEPTLQRVLGALAFGGEVGASEALEHVLDAWPDLRRVSVRDAAGTVVACATRGVSSCGIAPQARTPLDDQSTLDVPLLRCGTRVGILTAVSSKAFTAGLAALLTGVGHAFALGAADVVMPTAQAILDVEADLAALAAELDETVGEALVALRHTEPAHVDAAASAALAALRQIRRDLRATSLDDGLRAALLRMRHRGAVVDVEDAALDTVGPAAGVLVERVAELACRTAVGTPQITVNVDGTTVKLRVRSADNTGDASELARWRRRAAALRGELRHWPGVVELTLPTHP